MSSYGDPECLSCGRPCPNWGLCATCQDATERSLRLRNERITARLDGCCQYCGSVFKMHRCTLKEIRH